MKEIINKNEFYVAEVDTEKNQLCLELNGFWPSKQKVPNLIADFSLGMSKLSKGFGYMQNGLNFKVSPADVQLMLAQTLDMALRNGASKIALVSGGDAIKDLTFSKIKRAFGEENAKKIEKFENSQSAQSWLGQK